MYNIKTLINTLREETNKEKKAQEHIYKETLRENFRYLFSKIDNQLDKDIEQGTYVYAKGMEAIYINIEDTKNFLGNYYYNSIPIPLEIYLGYTKYTLYRLKSKPYYKEFLFKVFNHPNKVTHVNIVKTFDKRDLEIYIK